MAVYKATYCYPFLNTFDTRVVASTDTVHPCQYLKCKIDSSNKIITGYSIQILNDQNEVIFPSSNISHLISPVLDLPQNLGGDINTGINGDYLYIPFFQNSFEANRVSKTFNAVYYKARFKAQYIIQALADDTSADNSTNWTLDSNGYLIYSNWNGMLNQELVITGDLVLSIDPVGDKAGIWQVNEDGTLHRYYLPESPSEPVNKDLLDSVDASGSIPYVVISQGCYHDKIYQYNGTDFIVITSEVMWQDCEGHPISLTTNAGSYKWVITLYQGPSLGYWDNGILYDSYNAISGMLNRTLGGAPYWVDYSNLPVEWFDMTLNSGTILGSTGSRIQIASTGNINLLPGDNSTEIPVLQGRYIQLLYSNYNQLGARAYVETYDASYGHVYPLDGSFTDDLVMNSSYYCRFFKYSNDPESITAADIVRCAHDPAAPLTDIPSGAGGIYGGVNVKVGDLVLLLNMSPASLNGVYLVNADTNTAWTRAASYNSWGEFIGKIIFVREGDHAGTNYQSQAQAGGVLNEGNMPGSSELYFNVEEPLIIFPSLVTRTATFFSTTLPDADDLVIDGYTVKVGDVCLYQHFLYTALAVSTTAITWSGAVDIDADVLCKILQGKVYGNHVMKTGASPSQDYSAQTAQILKNSTTKTYIKPYVGLTSGMILYLLDDHTVTINTSVQSYIPIAGVDTKFWSITHADLGTALLSADATSSSVPYRYEIRSYFRASDENPFYSYDAPYLKIGDGDGGYTTLQVFQHYTVLDSYSAAYLISLSNPSITADTTPTGSTIDGITVALFNGENPTICVYNETTGTAEIWSTMWSTSITPNGYVYHEKLYDLIVNNKVYVERGNNYGAKYWLLASDPTLEPSASGQEYFLVENGTPPPSFQTFSVVAPSLNAIVQRFVTLKGFYYQWQQASWESYRWILTDADANILQDTGKKYDGDIEVTFYGLSNETSEQHNIYYAILYIEDSLNNSLQFSVKLIVDPSSASSLGVPFEASFDCGTHSVYLSYEDNAYIKPSVDYDEQTEVYDSSNPAVNYLWDDSLSYAMNPFDELSQTEDTAGWLSIYGKNFSLDPQISSLSTFASGLSSTVKEGVNYTNYFTKSAMSEPIGERRLTLSDLSGDTVGSFQAQTRVMLDDNYCGDFFEISIDTNNNIDKLLFKLGIPLNFTSNSSDSLNSDRDTIKYSFFRNNTDSADNLIINGKLLGFEGTEFKWMDVSSIVNHYYYVQNYYTKEFDAVDNDEEVSSDNSSNTKEFLHYHVLTAFADSSVAEYYPYYIAPQDSSGNYQALNSNKFLGNLCLINVNDKEGISDTKYDLTPTTSGAKLNNSEDYNFIARGAPVYWAEQRRDRGKVKLYQNDLTSVTDEKQVIVQYPINVECRLDGDSDDDYLNWPSSDDSSFWEEVDGVEIKGPALWSEIVTQTDWASASSGYNNKAEECGWKLLKAYKRHYNQLSSKMFEVVISVFDIATIYSIINAQTDLVVSGELVDGYSRTKFSYHGSTVATIDIKSTEI